MLAPEHRLHLPLSLLQLFVDMNGKDLPRMPSTSTRPPTLQEIVDHLNALTADSLPLALAHTTLNGDGGQGLGLLSGSRLSDIITTLAVFATRYEKGRWLAFLQTAVPACTEQDAQWLISLPAPVDSPLPAPQSQNKRKASSIQVDGPGIRNTKRPAATSSAPVRCSRSHQTLIVAPTVIQDMAPSHLVLRTKTLGPNSHRPSDDCMAPPSTKAYSPASLFSNCTANA